MVRLHVESVKSGETVSLQGQQVHYIRRVLRLGPGDELELFDGRGSAYRAQIIEASDERALVQVGSPTVRPVGLPICIVQCLPKAGKFEWILQKGTELGATCFAPAFSARSSIRLSSDKAALRLKRWRRIVQEAARQSRRADVPVVLGPQALEEAVEDTVAAIGAPALVLVLDEEEQTRRLSTALTSASNAGPVVLVVGPEGGFERREIHALQRLKALPVTMGPRILRAETSPLAALAVVLHLKGELG